MAALRIDDSLTVRLHRRAGAQTWGVTVSRFSEALTTSVRRAFAGRSPEPREVQRYVEGLHLEDLALATACACGHDAAWEHFVREHRPILYRAAEAIDRTGG